MGCCTFIRPKIISAPKKNSAKAAAEMRELPKNEHSDTFSTFSMSLAP